MLSIIGADVGIILGHYDSHIHVVFTNDNSGMPIAYLAFMNMSRKHAFGSGRGLIVYLQEPEF